MKCPRCGTNIYGTVAKCPSYGMPLMEKQTEEKKNSKIGNGLLDKRDFDNYTKNIELYKKKNKEPNILIPIVLILCVVIIIIFIALMKFMTN